MTPEQRIAERQPERPAIRNELMRRRLPWSASIVRRRLAEECPGAAALRAISALSVPCSCIRSRRIKALTRVMSRMPFDRCRRSIFRRWPFRSQIHLWRHECCGSTHTAAHLSNGGSSGRSHVGDSRSGRLRQRHIDGKCAVSALACHRAGSLSCQLRDSTVLTGAVSDALARTKLMTERLRTIHSSSGAQIRFSCPYRSGAAAT